MRLLDLFCGAGGAAMGYSRWFDITGVDVEPHPDYPFTLIRADAMEILQDREFLKGFDAIHASPPCPAYSEVTPLAAKDAHPKLIEPVREALISWGGPYVIENVQGAKNYMKNPTLICGSALGLKVQRHRLFETNFYVKPTKCHHNAQGTPVGVYGRTQKKQYKRKNGNGRGEKATSVEEAQKAMGTPWITDWFDLTDAIPPMFTQHVGHYLHQTVLERGSV